MLNSFWGKFGENLDKSAVTTVDSPAALFEMVSDPLHPVQAIRICNDDLLKAVYKSNKSNQLDKRNIFIAAFTTSLAQLKLYKTLEKLREQVLYYNTDSVFYRWKPGQPTIALGDYLEDMTDELKRGDYITEFVSGGLKNYGSKTHLGHVCCKVSGFTLNIQGKQHSNFQVMQENVLNKILDSHPH